MCEVYREAMLLAKLERVACVHLRALVCACALYSKNRRFVCYVIDDLTAILCDDH